MTSLRTIGALLRALRPGHLWKCVPVGAALVFGERLGEAAARRDVVATAAAFAAVAAAGYLVNDVVDRAADREDPLRRERPIAAGDVAPGQALLAALLLAGAAYAWAAYRLPVAAQRPLWAYGALTVLYSLALQRFAVLGAAAVAAGFVLRVLAGAGAAGVPASPWLLGLTGLLAMALVVAKREGRARQEGRPDLARWERGTDALLAASGWAYVVYTQAPDTVAIHGTHALGLTALPALGALARFRGRLRRAGAGQGPAELVAGDPLLLALGLLWLLVAVAVVYAR